MGTMIWPEFPTWHGRVALSILPSPADAPNSMPSRPSHHAGVERPTSEPRCAMPTKVAIKRLSAVEVDLERSHQHEFHAGRLGRALGFLREGASGALHLVVFGRSGDTQVLDGTFTFYDARKNHPERSAEFRFYYDVPDLGAYAEEGDLLVLSRPANTSVDVEAVIARKGSAAEARMLEAWGSFEQGGLFEERDAAAFGPAAVQDVLAWLRAPAAPPSTPLTKHPLYLESVASGRFPSTREMAHAAHGVVRAHHGTTLDPDAFLSATLEAETELYFAIEQAIGTAELEALAHDSSLGFAEVMAFAQRFMQARRSRRGESLQNHFASLLDDQAIPYTAQCPTERDETPDFIIPGRVQYHDPSFPEKRLRMVGCKTLLRERHRQWLAEAERVSVKFGLCVDPAVTLDKVRPYYDQLRVFLPKAILDDVYVGKAVRTYLGTVAELVGELRSALT